jgi:hypothetical protein
MEPKDSRTVRLIAFFVVKRVVVDCGIRMGVAATTPYQGYWYSRCRVASSLLNHFGSDDDRNFEGVVKSQVGDENKRPA